jgi:hypothetical protein
LRRKRVTITGEISKWKARVCIDGSMQKQGIHYEETYAPVVSWGGTRFFLTLAMINNWKTRQLDFVWLLHKLMSRGICTWSCQRTLACQEPESNMQIKRNMSLNQRE